MKNNTTPGFSSKIIRIYLLGASILLAFYMFAFHAGTMFAENALLERRVQKVSPFHFQRFQKGEQGVIKVDPLLTLYDEHRLLPVHIRKKIDASWTGVTQVMLDDDREFQVLAARLNTDNTNKIVYAVENANAVEWDDDKLVLIELTLGAIGLMLFVLTALYMVRAARRIAMPFLNLAEKLESDSPDNFEHIHPVGEQSTELLQIIKGLNAYRTGLALQLQREKSFTRYVSHELRTPMMIIKGAISNIRKSHNVLEDNTTDKKAVDKIEKATAQMQDLTQTFLMLAREEVQKHECVFIDDDFVWLLQQELAHSIEANQINFQWQLQEAFTLPAQILLIKAVVLNLLKNAFACSVNGNVNLFVSNTGIQVIDDGVGLDAKPRSYEGFGVGLVLVNDICKKYNWQFSLVNNKGRGCTAAVKF